MVYMTKGLLIKLSDLTKTKVEIKLFNGQRWLVEGITSRRYVIFFTDGKESKVFFQAKSTEELYDEIAVIYDRKGQQIAHRLNKNCRLLTTRDYKYWDITKPKNRALEVYALIMSIEEKEYEEEIQRYWYEERNKVNER